MVDAGCLLGRWIFLTWAGLIKIKGKQVIGRRDREVVTFLCSSMVGGTSSLRSAEAALPATILKSEGMGRERRVRGFHFL